MWRLRYYRTSVGGYRLELTTPSGFLYAYGHSGVIPDVELEAWLIHDAGLEGSQVDVQRLCKERTNQNGTLRHHPHLRTRRVI